MVTHSCSSYGDSLPFHCRPVCHPKTSKKALFEKKNKLLGSSPELHSILHTPPLKVPFILKSLSFIIFLPVLLKSSRFFRQSSRPTDNFHVFEVSCQPFNRCFLSFFHINFLPMAYNSATMMCCEVGDTRPLKLQGLKWGNMAMHLLFVTDLGTLFPHFVFFTYKQYTFIFPIKTRGRISCLCLYCRCSSEGIKKRYPSVVATAMPNRHCLSHLRFNTRLLWQ